MFGFKKILKELIEMRKEIEEIKKYSKPTPKKAEIKPKKERNGKIDHKKIEPEKRYPTDVSVAQLAKKMKITKDTLNNRINHLTYTGVRWANDKRHVYYVDIKGRTHPEKYLSLFAQDKLMERYGTGYNYKYSKKGE